MPEQFANTASTLLTAGYTASGTTLAVASTAAYPQSGNFRVRVDSELLLVNVASATSLSIVTYGLEGTTNANHNAASAVTAVLTAGGLEQAIADRALASSTVTTAGDLIVGSGAATVSRLAKGADGKVLTMVSGSPAWATASGGASLPLALTAGDADVVLHDSEGAALLTGGGATGLLTLVGALVTSSNSQQILESPGGASLLLGGGTEGALQIGFSGNSSIGICAATGTLTVGGDSGTNTINFGGAHNATNNIALGGGGSNTATNTITIGHSGETNSVQIWGAIAFFGGTPVGQQSANAALTDNTGGTPSTTLNVSKLTDDIGGGTAGGTIIPCTDTTAADQSGTINANFEQLLLSVNALTDSVASINTQLNAIRTLLTAYGLGS